ncbi:MAG: hypothetical protein IKF19_00275 [Bacilli bacterium]|nr:hypothetical protein [Bacilli bacterium]
MIKKIIKKLNLKNQDGKYNKKKLLCLYLIVFFLLPIGYTFGRYAYEEIKTYFLKTKKFYFNCDKLSERGSVIEMTNWSGVGQYSVTFNLNNYSNSILSSDEDIEYNIQYSCSNNVVCSIENNKTNGTITTQTKTDSFTIVITVPTETTLHDRDRVELHVTASATSPYEKTLTGTFRLVVGYYGLSHEIEDSRNSPYLNVRITNTLDYYVVREAFSNYAVNNQIDIPTYQNLSNENKDKCASAIVTLQFDPTKILLDMTSQDYQEAETVTKQTINNHEYIKSISFKIDVLSSKQIKFYKIDTTKDYTYPNNNNNSIVNVTYS